MTSLLTPVRLRPRAPRPRAVGALTAAAGLLAGLAVAISPAAGAATTASSHNPIGALHSDRWATATGIHLHGWALDQDQPKADAVVFAVVDGVTRASTPTTRADAGVTAKFHAGPTPGFTLEVPVPAGKHTVCVATRNLGGGVDTIFACLTTPLGRTLSSSQAAKYRPKGSITSSGASRSTVRVSGFATDPDYLGATLSVVLYLDGEDASTVRTSRTVAGAPKGTGSVASFTVAASVSTGTHQACVWAVNVGFGRNTFLGCTAVDTRAGQPLATGSPSTTILPKVLAEAKKHIGQRYVWGAVGPKTFDCSGLMLYSYRKFGFTTPRVSQDQARAARLIPASHAQPGDLVFYHDTEGDVYHVGMYLSPGLTVAAIDTAEGIDYQRIWAPSTASYGSFTHL